jgi:hypothetical protein
MSAAVLSPEGVTEDMRFYCRDCDTTYCGDQVLDGSLDLFIINEDRANPLNSIFRCHLCQEDANEYAQG